MVAGCGIRGEFIKEKSRKSHLGQTPWNKGVKGKQVAWNKGLKKEKTL